MNNIPKISIATLETDFAQLERAGVTYGYGVKAVHLDDTPQALANNRGKIDCSGYTRWALARATGGKLIIPDGSQAQREWCEQKAVTGDLHQVARYADAARYMNPHRLFICFIRPGHNGCGPVGHVWFLSAYDDGDNGTVAGTLESHGGAGINSRPWNARTLVREVYSVYELPTQ